MTEEEGRPKGKQSPDEECSSLWGWWFISPKRWGISQAPGAWVFGVGCLRAPEPESGSEGQLAGKRGWSAGRGRERAKKREPKGYVVN